MKYLLLCLVCLLLVSPDIFAQEGATPEPLPTMLSEDVTQRVEALPTLAPLTQTELAADGTQRPGWLDALTIVTGLLTVGTVAMVAINISRKKPEVA